MFAGRVLNIHGQKLTAPWMRAWKSPRAYGCVNNPDYLKIAFDFAEALVRNGRYATTPFYITPDTAHTLPILPLE